MRGPSVAVFANFTRALARACAPHLAQVVWRLKGALLLFLYDTMPFYGVYEVSFLNERSVAVKAACWSEKRD